MLILLKAQMDARFSTEERCPIFPHRYWRQTNGGHWILFLPHNHCGPCWGSSWCSRYSENFAEYTCLEPRGICLFQPVFTHYFCKVHYTKQKCSVLPIYRIFLDFFLWGLTVFVVISCSFYDAYLGVFILIYYLWPESKGGWWKKKRRRGVL